MAASRKATGRSGREATFCIRGTNPPIRGRPRKMSNSEKTTTTKNLSQHRVIECKRQAEVTIQRVIEGHYTLDTDYQADRTVREDSDSDESDDDSCSSNSSCHRGHGGLRHKCKAEGDGWECHGKSYSCGSLPVGYRESRSRLGRMQDSVRLSTSADGISFRLRPTWYDGESVSVKYSDLRNLLTSAQIAPQCNKCSSQTVQKFQLSRLQNTEEGGYFDGGSIREVEGSQFSTNPDHQTSHSRRISQPVLHQLTANTQQLRARSTSALSSRDHPKSARQERVNSDSPNSEGSRLIWTHMHTFDPMARPRPQWYEMKTPEFCVEARRNTALVRTQI